MTVEDLLKSSAVRNVMGDPKFIQGFRDGREGRPKGDSSEPYQVGYKEGVTTAAIRGGHATRSGSNGAA